MTLTAGLGAARSSLFVTADQTSVVSRNIANADNKFYSRKTANVITVPGSGVRVVSISRASEPALYRTLITANSDAATQKVKFDALNVLDQTVNDPELDASPAAAVSKLIDAIQQYATQPQSELSGQGAVTAARNAVSTLNSATSVVQDVRRQADAAINDSVNRINSLLAQFETVNREIMQGTSSGADITDALDTRDRLVAEISTEVGVRTVTRSGNDMALYTDSGVTLFDRTARAVTFQRSLTLSPGAAGNAVYIDGVAVTGPTSSMPIASGSIKGNAEVRDSITVAYQRQLDETARALIDIFAESDQTGGGLPDAPGLFTYSGAPAMPTPGVVSDGLAGSIRLNANVDPDRGGLVTRLRDGGIADPLVPNYVYNSSGGAGFSKRLEDLHAAFSAVRSFDASADIDVSTTLTTFTASSAAWLQEGRKAADSEYEYRDTLYQRASESFSKLTGVNLDEEMTMLLELERTYQTTSKLIGVIDEMFKTLVAAVG